MKIHFTTFGCKVNLYETENLKSIFAISGFETTDEPLLADVFLINSCTVTSSGDKKLFKEIRKLKSCNKNAVVALTGCFPQAFPDKANAIPDVDIICGTKNRAETVNLVKNFIENREKQFSVLAYNGDEPFEFMQNSDYESKTRAFIKIQDGCNMFCSYCIIPYSRGRFRSKSISDIISEVENFAKLGYKEVVLVGINLCFYGVDLGLRLIDALEAVEKIDGIERIRLGSLEPEVISDEDIYRMAKLRKLCPHFHLSLQSGCDKTLKAMNRHYDSTQYYNLVEKLRSAFENPSFTTDIMVGFPNETDEDFAQSVAFVEKIGFAKVHVFPYSQRDGTPAATMSGQISTAIKNERARKMTSAANALSSSFLQTQVGKTVSVLFEREKNDFEHLGHSKNYSQVKILQKNYNKSLRNCIFYVKILKVDENFCFGEILQ